uniref:Large ribosomal subunit protein mL62 n=1 Tax=Sphenodon punctatus TaxID=8508 RepID=A0A8D0GUZ7_SPHPU
MAARALRCLCRARPALLLPSRNALSRTAAAGSEFRSEYSLDKLYPPPNPSTATPEGTGEETKQKTPDIPLDCLNISYCRSSGPGGQNVNKVNSKAEVRFHLASADWIAEDVRQKMAEMHRNKINKSGELIVKSEVSRYQMRNLADCLQKIRDLIAGATEITSVKCKEDSNVIRARVEKLNRERLRQKRIHSITKQSRKVDID